MYEKLKWDGTFVHCAMFKNLKGKFVVTSLNIVFVKCNQSHKESKITILFSFYIVFFFMCNLIRKVIHPTKSLEEKDDYWKKYLNLKSWTQITYF